VGRGRPRPQAAAKASNHLSTARSVEPTSEVGATMSTPGRADHAQVAVKTWRLPAQQGMASQAFRSAANEAAVAVSSLHPNGGGAAEGHRLGPRLCLALGHAFNRPQRIG
jgi:hypothetical protein